MGVDLARPWAKGSHQSRSQQRLSPWLTWSSSSPWRGSASARQHPPSHSAAAALAGGRSRHGAGRPRRYTCSSGVSSIGGDGGGCRISNRVGPEYNECTGTGILVYIRTRRRTDVGTIHANILVEKAIGLSTNAHHHSRITTGYGWSRAIGWRLAAVGERVIA